MTRYPNNGRPILSHYLAEHTHTVTIDDLTVTYAEEPPHARTQTIRMPWSTTRKLTNDQLTRLFPDQIIILYKGSEITGYWPGAATLASQDDALKRAGIIPQSFDWSTAELVNDLIPALLHAGYNITTIEDDSV